MQQWQASAPSNIALIKYMGKSEAKNNTPANASFSYTLKHLISTVQLETHDESQDIWVPLETNSGTPAIALSEASQQRFLNHLQKLKALYQYAGSFIVRSCNNFPQGTGLASSASSFAALTMVANQALSDLTNINKLPTNNKLANFSKTGSGSSCRSFYAPWSLWSKKELRTYRLPLKKLHHMAIILDTKEKEVSSSQAHARVISSPYYEERQTRAEDNLSNLLTALKDSNWERACKIVWNEFWDMHELFKTANPPFDYMTEDSHRILKLCQNLWERHGDGPMVTMDAGPNVHLLYKDSHQAMMHQFQMEELEGKYRVIV